MTVPLVPAGYGNGQPTNGDLVLADFNDVQAQLNTNAASLTGFLTGNVTKTAGTFTIGAAAALAVAVITEAVSGGGTTTNNVLTKLGSIRPLAITATGTSVDLGTETFTSLAAHGLTTGDPVQVGTSNTLPSPLVVTTTYYAISVTPTTYRLATTLANALASTPINITSVGSGTMTVYGRPASPIAGSLWYNQGEGGIEFTDRAGAVATLWPRYHQATRAPEYASTTTFTVAGIECVDSSGYLIIRKKTSTTVDIATTGLNGIAASSLGGSVTVVSGTNAVTVNTPFAACQVGDVIRTLGGQARRVTAVSGTDPTTVESNWTSSEAAVTYGRGGRAPNTHYYLYAITNGTTPGLILSTRNAASGATVLDIPTGYDLAYRQLPFAATTDTTNVILRFLVSDGWPSRPKIIYQHGTTRVTGEGTVTYGPTNVLQAGTAGTGTAVDVTVFQPRISTQVILFATDNASADGYFAVQPSSWAGTPTGLSVRGFSGTHTQPVDADGSLEYLVLHGSGVLCLDVAGYIVDQVD